MRGTPNSFQRLMLFWRSVHPLNAVHAVRLDGPGDVGRLRQALEGALGAFGLRGLVYEPATGAFEYGHGAPPADASALAHPTLDEALEAELNRAFPPMPYNPIRAFLYPDGATHVLGLTYDHWTADAGSLMPVLAHTLGLYLGRPVPPAPPPGLYPPPLSRLLGRQFSNETVARMLVHTVRHYANFRRARRVHHADATNLYNACLARRLAPGRYDALRKAAEGVGATAHDLCIAALARALALNLPPHRRALWRRALGIGSVADLRRLMPARSAFHGVFLCYLSLVIDRPARCDALSLARRVARATTPMKQAHLYLYSLLNFRFGALMSPRVPLKTSMRFALRNMPLCGGISSFRLTADIFPEHLFRHVLEYLRAVSTGPTVPFVIQAAKLRDDLAFGVSFRTTAVSRDLGARIADDFVRELESALSSPALGRPAAQR